MGSFHKLAAAMVSLCALTAACSEVASVRPTRDDSDLTGTKRKTEKADNTAPRSDAGPSDRDPSDPDLEASDASAGEPAPTLDGSTPLPDDPNGSWGTVAGAPFRFVTGIAFPGRLVDGRPGLRIVLSSASRGVSCEMITPTAKRTALWIEVADEERSGPTFSGLAADVLGEDTQNDHCGSFPVRASGGNVSLSARNGRVTGALKATFPSGSVSGQFVVQLCDEEPMWGMVCL